ncbi:hypothetical protein ACOSP7_023017 [Xanthoceras sorbifolium]
MAAIEQRPLWLERGINVAELEHTSLPHTTRERGWEQYVQRPNDASEGLVREFYASMIPDIYEERGIVMVGGVEVSIQPSDINKYFGLVDQLELQKGLSEHEYFTSFNTNMVASLRMNGDSTWDYHRIDLKCSEIHLDFALWFIFCNHSILPTHHRNTIPSLLKYSIACSMFFL